MLEANILLCCNFFYSLSRNRQLVVCNFNIIDGDPLYEVNTFIGLLVKCLIAPALQSRHLYYKTKHFSVVKTRQLKNAFL